MANSRLKIKLRALDRTQKRPTKIIVFDIDNTIFKSVGTYEQDYNLKKFEKDNSFFNNLFLEKLPLFSDVKKYYDMGYLIIIQTARQKKWWLPFVLFFHGVKYHYLIQRPKGNISDTGKLKKSQLINFIISHSEIKNPLVDFVDDSKINRDELQTLNYVNVHNAEKLNRR